MGECDAFHIIKYYWVIKRNELLVLNTTVMDLKDTILPNQKKNLKMLRTGWFLLYDIIEITKL